MVATDYTSVVALVISLAAAATSFVQTQRTSALGRRPVLVIQYDGTIKRWVIQNIGYGPALNVTMAQQKESGDQSWYNPVRLPAIASGESFILEWLGGGARTHSLVYSLGVRYCDFLDKHQESRHFSYTRHDRCSVYRPNRPPKWIMPLYEDQHVRRYWEEGLPREPSS